MSTPLPLTKHTSKPATPIPLKEVLFRVVAVAAIMYGAFYGLQRLFMSPFTPAGFLGPSLRNCHTFTSLSAVPELPTHYTLPSGDKIPVVGLGMIYVAHISSHWRYLLGVWRSGQNQVGYAVKVRFIHHLLSCILYIKMNRAHWKLVTGISMVPGSMAYATDWLRELWLPRLISVQNEVEVGRAIRESDIPRSQIWLTSKAWIASLMAIVRVADAYLRTALELVPCSRRYRTYTRGVSCKAGHRLPWFIPYSLVRWLLLHWAWLKPEVYTGQ